TTVKIARRELNEAGLWLSIRGVFVPFSPFNSNQHDEKKRQKRVAGNIEVAPLYHLPVVPPLLQSLQSLPFLPSALNRNPTCSPATSPRRGRISLTCSALRLSIS